MTGNDEPQRDVDGPERTGREEQRRREILQADLDFFKGKILPLLEEGKRLKALLAGVTAAGRVFERQAFGLLLALGKTEKEANEEMKKWQS